MTKVCEHDTWPKRKARQIFWSTIFGKVTKWGCMEIWSYGSARAIWRSACLARINSMPRNFTTLKEKNDDKKKIRESNGRKIK